MILLGQRLVGAPLMFKTEKAQLRVQPEVFRHNCQIEVWRRGHPECIKTHHWKEDKGDHGKVQERDPIVDQGKIQEKGLTEDQRKVLHKLHVEDRLEDQKKGHLGDQKKGHPEDQGIVHQGDQEKDHHEGQEKGHLADRKKGHLGDQGKGHLKDQEKGHQEDQGKHHRGGQEKDHQDLKSLSKSTRFGRQEIRSTESPERVLRIIFPEAIFPVL